MQNFDLIILGCSSATPTSKRNQTAQLLNIAERFFLIDCGEATQIQLRKAKVKFQKIDNVFISHLHGDHYLGLVGLLSSMHLLGRTADLHLYCPEGLEDIINVQFKYSQTLLQFNIIYHVHTYCNGDIIFEDEYVEVRLILLNHRIPCCGFLFTEKERPATISSKKKPRSYAYCSDTCYDERIIDLIKGVDLLYHEATFMNNMEHRARETFHSTTIQAATIAKKAEVRRLMIGHYSARYKDLLPLLAETQTIFKDSILAIEGEKTTIKSVLIDEENSSLSSNQAYLSFAKTSNS